jgi:hypothetical protein
LDPATVGDSKTETADDEGVGKQTSSFQISED